MTTHPLLSEWDKYSAGAIGRFVAAIQLLSEETPRSTFSTNIGSLVHKHFAGNFSALARIMRVRGFTVSCWAHGTQRPSPASLLALSFCFGGEMLDWVVANMESAGFQDTRPISQSVADRVRRPLQRQPRENLQEHLALVAQNAELPPPSFRTVCRRLGLDQTVANRSFPDLAEVIKARYKCFLAEAKSARKIYRRNAVESALKQLRLERMTLSFKHLRAVLPPDYSTRDKLVRMEFRQQLGDVDTRP